MSKYNVGDVVKLRDDLEEYIEYGEMDYNKEMDRMKNKPIKLLRKSDGYENCYEVEDEIGENWFLSDEMIEGLWEECNNEKNVTATVFENMNNNDNFPKQTLKLIDVLNMIAKGELKEGTKVKWDDDEYIYTDNGFLENSEGDELIFFVNSNNYLNDEVELIEPPCEHEWEIETIRNGIGDLRRFRRCVKCGFREEAKERNVGADKTIEPTEVKIIEPKCNHEWRLYTLGRLGGKLEYHRICKKCGIDEEIEPEQFREDTKLIEPTDNTKIEELDKEEMLCLTLQCAIAVLTDKLNEVIKKVDAQTTVLLAQDKYIKEIKEQLDY